jgi:hypothetical protein
MPQLALNMQLPAGLFLCQRYTIQTPEAEILPSGQLSHLLEGA